MPQETLRVRGAPYKTKAFAATECEGVAAAILGVMERQAGHGYRATVTSCGFLICQ